MQSGSLYFDASVPDLYIPLKTGATTYIPPKMYYTFPKMILAYIEKNNINTLIWVPSALCNVVNCNALSLCSWVSKTRDFLRRGYAMQTSKCSENHLKMQHLLICTVLLKQHTPVCIMSLTENLKMMRYCQWVLPVKIQKFFFGQWRKTKRCWRKRRNMYSRSVPF